MQQEMLARVAVLETQFKSISDRGVEMLADLKEIKRDISDIKLQRAETKGEVKGAWWATTPLRTAANTMWTGLIAALSAYVTMRFH